MKIIKFDTIEEMSKFLREDKTYFFSLIIEAIEEAWSGGLDDIEFLQFHIKDDVLRVNAHKTSWLKTLNYAIEYFEEIEAYEKCGKISELINKIFY
jgi:hypothetical protein